MASNIEGETRNDNDIDIFVGRERFTYRFHQMEDAFLQILTACIPADLHILIIYDLWEKNRLPLSHKIIEQLTGINLIRQ